MTSLPNSKRSTDTPENLEEFTDSALGFGDDAFDNDNVDADFDDSSFDDGAFANENVNQNIDLTHVVTDVEAGLRLDKVAAIAFTDFSRAQLQDFINDGKLCCNGTPQKPKYRCKAGDELTLVATLEQHGTDLPEDIALDIVFEDDAVIVINKPVGMVVHPGAGNMTGTLVNALLHHFPNQKHLPRAGLVHRIDKDTSGLLIVAKTKAAQMDLTDQLKDKAVYRHYQCVVAGDAPSLQRQKTINAPIGRNRNQRTKMAVTSQGRDAVTHLIGITALNDNYCLLDVALETGRTHQIRVHLSHLGHPLVGDRVYGSRRQLRAGLTTFQRSFIEKFPRQALHAYELGFIHPTTGEDIEVQAPLPDDMQQLIEVLKGDVAE